MPDVVLVSATRTAIGTAVKGTLANTTAYALGEAVVAESLAQTGLAATDVDDLVFGESMYGGGDIARYVAVTTGLTNAPGVAVNRHCASGLTAISIAAAGIQSGMQDVVIAGGVQSSSTSPMMSYREPFSDQYNPGWISPSHPDRPDAPNRDMSITVGWNTAVEAELAREEIDAWAFESHQKAIRATDDGRLAEEIVGIDVTQPDGTKIRFDVDEHPRRTSTMDKLASLKPLHPEIEGFSITAGNAAGVNDAAAAVTLMTAEKANALGLRPLARISGWSSIGVDPARTGMAPTDMIPLLLARVGRTLDDIDLFEINEAFAPVPMAAVKLLGIDPAKVNPVGSGCSLGHPIAASGARMTVSLVHELRRRGGGTGIATMCAGGGMGGALLIDVEAP
jgi:acetyl-CoA acetyltransferase family protein